MRAVKEKAYAKINLYLDVISRREDGFHDIKSVMHSVSLADEITVIATPSSTTQIKMFIKGNKFLPADEKNLAVRAARLYLETAQRNANIEIRLDKKIPVAAGLAGGSSDAAATLRAMNKLFGKIFTDRAMLKMAAAIGSDVPYCLYGKTALCEGRGEIITKLPDSLRLNAVLAIANERIATPSAYKKLDEIYSSFDGSIDTGGDEYYNQLISSMNSCGQIPLELFNIFEKAVLPICKGATKIKSRLSDLGARSVLMSGSGPSVYGIFDTLEQASLASKLLSRENITAYAVKSV